MKFGKEILLYLENNCKKSKYTTLQLFSFYLIKKYKRLLSPSIGSSCRFHPSCSSYGLVAIKKHGFISGWTKTTQRIMKCKTPNGGMDFP